ncbi:MAG: AraC family transcriptional regulator [Sphingobacterium mizutaii]|nr:AraC family transcriptional regulator [Sphingobacterium mizutaii]
MNKLDIMIIKQLTVPKTENQSFQMRRDYFPKHQSIWHYHEEWELVYVKKGSGTLFIGDRIKSFHAGIAVLIPSQIPHYWLFDEISNPEKPDETIDCVVVHFIQDFGIEKFLQAPELVQIKQLLDQTSRGRYFPIDQDGLFDLQIQKCIQSSGMTKFFLLLECLQEASNLLAEELISTNYSILNQSEDQYRMNSLMGYIRENYKHRIMLQDLAKVAGMTENSFCRYFKNKTGKTPVQFINEVRISHACFQLRNSNISLKEVCYDSGFNNFVSFHKSFKSITGTTPNQFRT